MSEHGLLCKGNRYTINIKIFSRYLLGDFTMAHVDKSESFLLRLRNQDTPTGVSGATIKMLMERTGLNRTEIAHLALRQMANRYLPQYEMDNGPLTAKQSAAIRANSTASSTPDESFSEGLFG
jgi:hypothetical protein